MMMKVITSNEILLKYVINTLITVPGELNLFTKINSHLIVAENWVSSTFVGESMLDEIVADNDSIEFSLIANIIVCEAMRRAIPALDLILTPNGFGIVSNQNIVPASKERVARLIAEMEASRDLLLTNLVSSLSHISDWCNSSIGSWFGTIIPFGLSLPILVGCKDHIWNNYLGLRSRIIGIEATIADDYISPEYMQELRNKAIGKEGATPQDDKVISVLTSIIIDALNNADSIEKSNNRLRSLVDYIRTFPADFPTWNASKIAIYFNPPVFKNKTESHGFYF